MANNSICIYHPRQGERAQELNKQLQQHHFTWVNQPLFNIEAGEDYSKLARLNAKISQTCYIFTSQYAVEYLMRGCQTEQVNLLKHQTVIAVGQATADKLTAHGFTQIEQPVQQNSEGIIDLLSIKKCSQAYLFKGEQGRSHISDSFKLANKPLKTYNVYKRNWQNITPEQFRKIQTANIFVFTSGESALYLLKIAPNNLKQQLYNKPCLVPSERVKIQLKQQGLKQLINMNGASNQMILNALIMLNGR